MAELPARFRSTMTPPPGGMFFYEHAGERVEARTWLEMRPKVEALMAKHGLKGYADLLVAAYMCPHMPGWYCTGAVPARSVTTVKTALANAVPYYRRELVPFDEISRRMRICHECPKHERDVCLTCTGILDRIKMSFGGRRVSVLEDKMSGVCSCAKTFEAVVASVEHGDEPWPDAPDCCWRKRK